MRGRKKYFFDIHRIAAALNKSLIWFFIALKNYKDYIKNKDKKNA